MFTMTSFVSLKGENLDAMKFMIKRSFFGKYYFVILRFDCIVRMFLFMTSS